MATQHRMRAVNPKIHLQHPVWWHEHGSKMEVKEFVPSTGVLVLSASAASLRISRRTATKVNMGWDIDWEVVQCRPTHEQTNGRVFFSTEVLRAAFSLSDDPGQGAQWSQWLLNQCGGDLAVQGCFIRWMDAHAIFLNIPCPGTGHDGDQNISLVVTHEIKEAVRQLLASV